MPGGPPSSTAKSLPSMRTATRTSPRTIGRLYAEGYLCPMQHIPAVQKLHDDGLDRRRSIVWEHHCRDDHVAPVAEGDRDRGLAWPVASGERVGATATLHPGNRDGPASAQGRNLGAEEIEVAHAIKIGVIRDTGRAIAGAELGTKIKLGLGAAIGRAARKCAAGSPLIDGEWPLHLRPDRASDNDVTSPVSVRRPYLVPSALVRRAQHTRRAIVPASPAASARANFAGFIARSPTALAVACRLTARFSPRTRGRARSAAGPDRHSP